MMDVDGSESHAAMCKSFLWGVSILVKGSSGMIMNNHDFCGFVVPSPPCVFVC